MRRRDLVFLSSGAAALVLEVVWSRLLGRALGSDAAGTGVVIGVFLLGLGIGALALGGPARRARDPRRLYLALEATVALWAIASPFALEALGAALAPDSLVPRVLLASALLLVPTIAMGGTFPVMGRLSVADARDAGPETSRFYGANTLGAAAGAMLAPFALLPALGLTGALLAAAALDLGAGLLALTLALPGSGEPERPAPAARAPWRPLLAAPLLLGCASLIYEVALVRVLITLSGASVYAFAIVLAVYLLGLGAGSAQSAAWLRAPGSGRRVLFRAAALAPLLCVLGLCLLRLKVGRPAGAPLENLVLHDAGVVRLWISHALLAAPALCLPAFAFGAALPAAVAASVERDPDAAREPLFARVYAVNTLGSTLGALGGTFLLLPHGPDVAVRVAIGAALAAALVVARKKELAPLAALAAACALLSRFALGGEPPPGVVLHEVGVQATATVTEADEGGRRVRALRINGKVVASTAPVDLRLQRMLGHVPGVLHGEVESALVIGLGTGMTAGSLLDLPTLRSLEVVEISSSVVDAARAFDAWNGGLLDDPRVRVAVGDGRHRLLVDDARYDLVTSDPIHPWTRGSSDLYALEHFRRMAEHLAPGGVASQWLPLYQLSDRDVRTVVATWCAAFPRVAAWLTAYDLALIGWNDPPPGLEGWWDRPLPPRVAAALAQAGVDGGADLAALQVADDAALRAFAEGVPPMLEDRPVLEFRAPRSFLSGYSREALEWAGRPGFVERLPAPARARAREVRAALGRFLDRLDDGLSLAAREYGEELLGMPPRDG